MTKAILFPYSKETKHFIDFEDLSLAKVCAYVSPKIVGESLPKSINHKFFDSFDDIEDIDAQILIIGYTQYLSELRKIDYLEKALIFALERKLDVYAFDDIYCEKYQNYLNAAQKLNLVFYSPQITQDQLEINRIVNAKEIPSLMIIGTSASQGKFTLLMMLKRIFGSEAFYISSEHHGKLFDLDITFPYGVQAGVKIPIYKYSEYLSINNLNIGDSKKIIISCTQSGLLPFTLNDGVNRSYTLATIAFYLAIKPKHVILVFNPYYDDENFIQGIIRFIKNTGNAKIECLAFSDNKKNNNKIIEKFSENELEEIRKYYSLKFKLKCLNIKYDNWSFLKNQLNMR